ncbi:divergent polysaccharide deacetylase family protein [Paenibacillus sp. UNC451MF]|uniref:divergent polysaccharide deacetylase family protein n=1 Tax=Paenibacillus sp. UNC451MF TaxID=1449063 RepID=UPI00048F1857|nr:divergent polysaccharide deacetylase family protein [Paenibacillus sp. UNC451MF]
MNRILVGLICMTLLAVNPMYKVHAGMDQPESRATNKQIAIVIDDLGNDMEGTEEILNMPIPLTVAVMPFLPTTKQDAERAHQVGHEVLVHLPMEPLKANNEALGPGVITTRLSEKEIRKRVLEAIDDVPYAVGINNHMGSKATADSRVMNIILQICKERGLFFLDSKTNYWSVVGDIGKQLGVPVLENKLFLDDRSSKSHISKQLKAIRDYLKHQDQCIAIGHVGRPGKNTASVLKASIPDMTKEAEFVPVSKLLKNLTPQIIQ